MKETGNPKEVSFSLFSSPVFLKCLPLAEINRKPDDKGAWEAQFAGFQAQNHRVKYEIVVLEEKYSK